MLDGQRLYTYCKFMSWMLFGVKHRGKGQAVAVVLDFGLWVRRLGLNGYKGSGLRVTGTASH